MGEYQREGDNIKDFIKNLLKTRILFGIVLFPPTFQVQDYSTHNNSCPNQNKLSVADEISRSVAGIDESYVC